MFCKKVAILFLAFGITLPMYSVEQKQSFSWSDVAKFGSAFVAGALFMYFVKSTKKTETRCTSATCTKKIKQLEEQLKKARKENEIHRDVLPHAYFANNIGTQIYITLQKLELGEEYEVVSSSYKLQHSTAETGNLWQVVKIEKK